MARRAALLAAAAASVLAALTLFLPYAKVAGVSASGFELLTRADVLLLVANLLAAALLAAAALTGSRPLQALGLAAAAMALGGLLFTGLELVKQIGRPAPALSLGLVPDSIVPAKVAYGAILGILASAVATGGALAATFLAEREPSADRRAAEPSPARAEPSPARTAEPSPARTAEPSPARTAEPSPAASAGPAAGWYDDPTGTARRRYWDGSRWTDHVQA